MTVAELLTQVALLGIAIGANALSALAGGGAGLVQLPALILLGLPFAMALATHKVQMADQALYRYVGIEPTEQAILVNKSSVHFRADFAPIAHQILVAAAPGPMIADPAKLPWKRLRKGMRLSPLGPVWNG